MEETARLTFRTVMTLLRGGQFRVLGSLSKVARDSHRVAFLAGALTSGVLQRLAVGPLTLNALAADLRLDPATLHRIMW